MFFAKPRDERGAVAPFVAVVMVLLVGLASFAVDLGYQRVAARDMQAVADIVAMDMARELDGTKGSVLKNTDRWKDATRASVARNDDSAVGDALEVVPCGTGLNTLPNERAVVCALPGVYDPVSETFSEGGNDAATHVRVVTRTRVDYFFPVFADDGWVTKIAYAEGGGQSCFSVGSYAAQLDSGASPILGPLLGALGSNVNLSALDYRALADAQVGLVDLLGVDVGAGTMGEVLRGNQLLSLRDWYLATATALQQGSGNTAAVGLLQVLAAKVPGMQIPVADLLSLGTGGTAGLDTGLNVLDLITAAAALATKQNGVSLPGLNVNLGPLANVTATASIIEAPRKTCRRKRDTGLPYPNSSAVRVQLSSNALDLKLGILDTKVSLSGSIEVAKAEGRLVDLTCNPNRITIQVNDSIIDVRLRLEVSIKAIFGLIPAISGPIMLTGANPNQGQTKVIDLPDDSKYDVPIRFSNASSGLPAIRTDTSQLRALGLPLGALLDVILAPLTTGLVNPLIQGLDTVLLTPLLRSLGMDLSGADVFIHKYPQCEGAALRG